MLTWITVNQKNIRHNIKQFRFLINRDCLLMPVIKSNAYGHGFLEVAKICQHDENVNRICVIDSLEALKLITKFPKTKPIQILSFYELDDKILLKLAKKPVIFPVYQLKQAKFLDRIGECSKNKIKIHLKLDVGTSRVGILEKDLKEFITKIKKLKNIEIEGVFSHLSSSEESREVTNNQLELFNKLVKIIENGGVHLKIKHITCSAASILYPHSHFNAIRMGLSIYGLHPSKQTTNNIKLKPVLSWHTKIIHVKNVPTNTKIGYDGTYTTTRPSKIATIPVGYWDGLSRKLSNTGEVLIKGIRCPIIGKVCMNLTMVDITNVPKTEVGDLVTLIGRQKNSAITAEDMANWADTINYETIDRINPLIPRIVI